MNAINVQRSHPYVKCSVRRPVLFVLSECRKLLGELSLSFAPRFRTFPEPRYGDRYRNLCLEELGQMFSEFFFHRLQSNYLSGLDVLCILPIDV